jgi:hypothetical protein
VRPGPQPNRRSIFGANAPTPKPVPWEDGLRCVNRSGMCRADAPPSCRPRCVWPTSRRPWTCSCGRAVGAGRLSDRARHTARTRPQSRPTWSRDPVGRGPAGTTGVRRSVTVDLPAEMSTTGSDAVNVGRQLAGVLATVVLALILGGAAATGALSRSLLARWIRLWADLLGALPALGLTHPYHAARRVVEHELQFSGFDSPVPSGDIGSVSPEMAWRSRRGSS